jgi:hypothetical protein
MNIGMAGTKLAEFFTKEGLKKAGQQAVKAATSEGVKQAGKRAVRDTLLYSAAEQVIPRALGADAPDIKDTLVRQATGNIIAEGATAGLQKAFPMPRARTVLDSSGKGFVKPEGNRGLFGLPGMKPNPFLPSTYMQEEGVPLGTGPTTPTGATKFTAEPEYNEIVRPSTTDLSGVQAREALSEREKYEYRLKMAQIEKMPSMVMHSSPDSTAQSLFNIAQGALNPGMTY